MVRFVLTSTCATTALALAACSTDSTMTAANPPLAIDLLSSEDALEVLAHRDALDSARLSFEEFKSTVYKEPFENGAYIVDGDTMIADDQGLLEFYIRGVVAKANPSAFTISTFRGYENIWNQDQKTNLSYCVSTRFGAAHDTVLEAMKLASSEWERAADVRFVHDAEEDAVCNSTNSNIVFDINPVNLGPDAYLARAFFPSDHRVNRNVYINATAMQFPNIGPGLTLTGIMRHELGHTIGARHEHTRPESGTCYEDTSWRPVTNYDPFSVMHYPQCNGMGDWTLTLTAMDRNGIACVYGPAPGFVIDRRICRARPKDFSETYSAQ